MGQSHPSLSDVLRALRTQAGLTQEELAERAGISVRTVSDAERVLRTTLYRDTAERIADALLLEGTARDQFYAAAGAVVGSFNSYGLSAPARGPARQVQLSVR